METPTKVEYRITEGDFTVLATIYLPTGRITLEKEQGFGGSKKDYHFEDSTPEKVEAFAKCALRAAQLSRICLEASAEVGYIKTDVKKRKKKGVK